MALPASGVLSFADIAVNQGTNSIGIVTPYSLYQMNVLAGLQYDYGSKVSNFYSYPGYGYKFGSPSVLHDLGLSNRFPTSSSSIIDTSGNGRTANFVTGTGLGSSVNVTGYTTSFPGNIATQTSSQYSIRLDNITKYDGNTSFTWLAWFKVSSFSSSYNGIIACEGRSGSTPIGHSLYITNVGGYSVVYQRWNGTSGSNNTLTIPFPTGTFALNTWYMVMIGYGSDGTYVNYIKQANAGLFQGSTGSFVSTSVTTSPGWACFAGLRYNNWLDGNIGYVACYGSKLSGINFEDIFWRTRDRYI